MEQPKSRLTQLTKHLWYLIIIRLPKAIQQQIETIDLSILSSYKPNFAENKRYWDTIVLHYWQKRFEQSQKDSILRFRDACISTTSGLIKCNLCNKKFDRESVNPCWRCNAYTCTKCATVQLKDAFPKMKIPTSCTAHTYQCTRCEQVFIPLGQEEHCFDCQNQTGMYIVRWSQGCKVDAKLPYGSFQLQQRFAEFIKKAHLVKKNVPPNNGQILIGGPVGDNGYYQGGGTLSGVVPYAIAIGTTTSVSTGYNAYGNNNNH